VLMTFDVAEEAPRMHAEVQTVCVGVGDLCVSFRESGINIDQLETLQDVHSVPSFVKACI